MGKKVTIIGAGFVGSTAAYTILAQNIVEKIALIDINRKLVNSQAMDLSHSIPFFHGGKIIVGGYSDIKDSQIVVITCGAAQKPGQTRIDLVKKNAQIIKEIVPKIFRENPDAILLMVTNPVDVLTYLACQLFPEKEKQIIGSGTILDSARFRFLLGQHFNVNPQSVHAYIVGEHGDSELPLLSTASIGNISLFEFPNYSQKAVFEIFDKAKNAAYAIIEGKQATYYAIAAGIAQIVETILDDENRVLPLSHRIKNQYRISDVCLSMPVVLGRTGIKQTLNLKINADELKKLQQSAEVLKEVINEVK